MHDCLGQGCSENVKKIFFCGTEPEVSEELMMFVMRG